MGKKKIEKKIKILKADVSFACPHEYVLYCKTVLPYIWSSSNFMDIVASNLRQSYQSYLRLITWQIVIGISKQ